MAVSYLPTLLQVRADLHTALARIHAYEVASARMEWSRADTTGEQGRAWDTIRARVLAAANRLDLVPQDRQNLVAINRQLRIENEGLRGTVARLSQQIAQLTDANVRQAEGEHPSRWSMHDVR